MTKNILENAREFVTHWFKINKIEVLGNGSNSLGKNPRELYNAIYLDYKEVAKTFKIKERARLAADGITGRIELEKLNREDITAALEEHVSIKVLDRRKKVAKRLKFDADEANNGDFETLTSAITSSNPELAALVIKHWMWLVKRKMKGAPVINHIMPVLYGPQGSGKTVFLNKLVKPLNEFRLNIKMNNLTDDRYLPALERNFVVVFDEMQGVHRTDIDALKNQITTDYNHSRILYTQDISATRQNCSFIGATNRFMNEQILDATGMRRFYQINTLPQLNWKLINEIDFVSLWISIDEGRDHGYLTGEILSELRRAQAKDVLEDPLDLFILDHDIIKGEGLIDGSKLYDLYKYWCEDNGYRVRDQRFLFKRLRNMGFTAERRMVMGKRGIFIEGATIGETYSDTLIQEFHA